MPRRAQYLRPIHTEKMEITWSLLGLNASGVQSVLISIAKKAPTGTEIHTGSHIKWLYIEMNLNGVDNSGTAQIFHWLIQHVPKDDASLRQNPSTYDSLAKSLILKRGMEMLPEIPLDSGGTVQTKRIFVVKIPKRYQRRAEDDAFRLQFISTSASLINFCGFSIFKEVQ